MLNRKTTAYLVRVPTEDPNSVIPELIARCPEPVEQTASQPRSAGLRFRIDTDDERALAIARQIAGDLPFTLSTGYGVHHRDIAVS